MKYLAKVYAKVFSDLAQKFLGKENALIKDFLALVKKNGDRHQLKKIVSQAQKLLLQKQGLKKLTVETSRQPKKQIIQSLKNFVKNFDIVEEKINPDLIAGLKLVLNDEKQLDFSLAKKLRQIFP